MRGDIRNSRYEIIIGLKIVSRLNFSDYLDCILQKAGYKVNKLARVTPYVNINKRCLLINSFLM